MNENINLALSRLERDPNGLLRLLILVGVVAMVLILSLTGYGIYRDASSEMLQSAEDDARAGADIDDSCGYCHCTGTAHCSIPYGGKYSAHGQQF